MYRNKKTTGYYTWRKYHSPIYNSYNCKKEMKRAILNTVKFRSPKVSRFLFRMHSRYGETKIYAHTEFAAGLRCCDSPFGRP